MLKDKSFLISLSVFSVMVVLYLLSIVLGGLGFGKDLAFYSLAAIIVVSAIGVVAVSNIVYSGFLLVLTFVSIAGIYMLLNADFIAAAQILINGGAVTIMLIFAIFLTNSKADTANIPYSGTYRYVAFVFVGLGLFLILLLRMTGISFNFGGSPFITFGTNSWAVSNPVSINTTEKIGQMFFNQYLIPFEVASVILLMALIGAIVLALKDSDMKDPVLKEDLQESSETEKNDIQLSGTNK